MPLLPVFAGDNTIGDGRSTCRYADAPALFERIGGFLAEHGVGPETCVAVECPNTLPGALTLLTLFQSGNSFIVAPPTVNQDETKPIPNFCQYRLTVLPGIAPAEPAGFLKIETNGRFNGLAISPGKLMLRTSGSMGASKIVVHSHQGMVGNALNVVKKYGLTAECRFAVPVPIAHMYGFGAEFLPAILVGASMDLQEKTNLLKYLDREKNFKPTVAFATPAICEMLRKGYKSPRSNYRVFVTSGQRIGEDLFRAFDPLVSGKLINQYGSTEMGATSACVTTDSLDTRATTIGAPLDGVELRIDEGQLYCRHPHGFEGYLDEDGNWLHREAPGGWYRTGDLAVCNESGQTAVLGRADASVNRSGYLVLLSDIERVMEKLDAAGEVAVVPGRGETKQGQRIVAFCVLRTGQIHDGAGIRQRCFDVLPHYAIPDEVRVLERLPLLASGKVDRQALSGLAG
jgi:acyl-coenzyme A synthetase/AMP-(fatty) acid ligase